MPQSVVVVVVVVVVVIVVVVGLVVVGLVLFLLVLRLLLGIVQFKQRVFFFYKPSLSYLAFFPARRYGIE